MSLIVIQGNDLIKTSRAYINSNFQFLFTLIGAGGGGGVSGSATLDFGPILDGETAALTFTVTGAAAGRAVVPAWPASLPAGFTGMMRVSATNTIEVRLVNLSKSTVDPPSAVFGATVL